MKNKFIKFIVLFMIITVSSIYLSGCMMTGMGMMHGGGNHEMNMENHNNNKFVIKEYNTNEYKITAEFPSSIKGNTDICRIKILNKTANSVQTDVEVYLEVLSENTEEHGNHSHGKSSFKISHSKFENGYFIFTPNIESAGIFQLTFSIERIKTNIFSDPIRIEHLTENNSETDDAHSHSNSDSVFSSPYFYVGAAAMAVMMVFMIR